MSHVLPGGAWLALTILSILAVALTLAGIRLARGPTLPDRVVAFDLIAVVVMGKITTLGIVFDEVVFLDAVIVLALLAFLATVAFGRYILSRNEGIRRWPR